MKKITLIIILVFISVPLVIADNISKEKAREIAKNVYYQKASSFKKVKYEDISFSDKIINAHDNESDLFYVFNLEDENGFVIISADDDVFPVIGYSFESTYSGKDLPPALENWLQKFKKQIKYVKENNLEATKQIESAWDKYSKNNGSSVRSTAGPLTQTMWDQDCYYNELCPDDYYGACGHARVGCVAVAMAQVMKYHNYPPQGTGSHGYESDYGYLYVDFGSTTYNWDAMPDYITSDNFEIAQIGYHCGVAVEMMYGPNGSGASSENVGPALINYFGYSPEASLEYKSDYNDDEWRDMLITEIDEKHPMYYSGYGDGGHAFVCDGYQDEYFHFNWGWGGLYNGYFTVDNLHPGTHNYSYWQSALINAQPSEAPSVDFTVNTQEVLTGSSASFTDSSKNTVTSWSWIFEGGTPSTSDQQNPENIFYNIEGTYPVKLIATNWNGSDTLTKMNYIAVTDNALPIAEFDADKTNICLDSTVSFTDKSLNSPYTWHWEFEPNTVTFIEGTGSYSQNPVVQFNEAVAYAVTLTSTNQNGSNSITKEELINAGGLPLPFTETFEVANFKDHWTIENPDDDITWDGYYKLSGNLPSRKAAWVNFYQYDEIGERDRLITPILNFKDMESVVLSFTHAYAYYNADRYDSLIILLSDDCGTTWKRVFEAGDDFATHTNTYDPFVPQNKYDWCGYGYGDDCHEIDLSEWIGVPNVMIAFESYNGHGNMIYIDDVVITGEPIIDIDERAITGFCEIYPNPTSGIININLKGNLKDAIVKVFNVQGQQVFSVELNKSPVKLDLGELNSGVYFIQVINGENFNMRKIIKN